MPTCPSRDVTVLGMLGNAVVLPATSTPLSVNPSFCPAIDTCSAVTEPVAVAFEPSLTVCDVTSRPSTVISPASSLIAVIDACAVEVIVLVSTSTVLSLCMFCSVINPPRVLETGTGSGGSCLVGLFLPSNWPSPCPMPESRSVLGPAPPSPVTDAVVTNPLLDVVMPLPWVSCAVFCAGESEVAG